MASVWFLSHSPDVKRLLHQFLDFFRGTFPYVPVDLVCPWEEVSSGSPYVAILNQNSYRYVNSVFSPNWQKLEMIQVFINMRIYK